MDCRAVDALLEALAAGDAAPAPGVEAHVASCARCRARLALARAIEATLAGRPEPEPPAGFADAVMARVRRARWRAEQRFDVVFNLAVAAGLLFVLAGAAGLIWASGLPSLAGRLAPGVQTVAADVAARASAQLPVVTATAAFLTTALALWWWVDRDAHA